MTTYLEIAINASIHAGCEILKIYDSDNLGIEQKKDESPLTLADNASNACIQKYLKTTLIPVISEETKQSDYLIRKKWQSCWIIDPLDGTKEFIKKNDEFTVNIALCNEGQPVLGVIYVPVTRELYYAVVDTQKAYKVILDKNQKTIPEIFNEKHRIKPANQSNDLIRIVGSRSHMNQTTQDFIDVAKERYSKVEIVSKGSSLKFCLIAEGKADVYPRFAPTMEWDTAAGHAICKAVGVKVNSEESNKELAYNKSNLLNPFFLVCS